jgi:hypothetical protein
MCKSIHASTLTNIFFRSSHQKAVHTWNPLIWSHHSVLTFSTLLTPRSDQPEPEVEKMSILCDRNVCLWENWPLQQEKERCLSCLRGEANYSVVFQLRFKFCAINVHWVLINVS